MYAKPIKELHDKMSPEVRIEALELALELLAKNSIPRDKIEALILRLDNDEGIRFVGQASNLLKQL